MSTSPRPTALIIWTVVDHGVRSAARTLAGRLSGQPHDMEVIEADLAQSLAGHSILAAISSFSGLRLDEADLSSRGWTVVQNLLAGRHPRVVVAMDPVAGAVVDNWRSEGQLRAPCVGILSSLRVDPGWARTAVDRLSVADEVQAEAAMELGLSPERLVPCGIAVCGGFSSVSPDEKGALRSRFGIPADRPVVLVVTHGLEPDELTGALFQLSMVAERASLLFDVARDAEAADLLRRRVGLYGIQARMFGKVEEAGQLWAAADLVLAKPHIYVEQRALALRLPVVHLMPKSEADRETARIYVERGIGRVVQQISSLAADIDLQLGSIEQSRKTIGEISRRSAAVDTARLVAQVASQAEQILAEIHEPADGDDIPSPSRQGPLEVIGVAEQRQVPAPPEDLEAAQAEANRQVIENQNAAERWNRRAELAHEKGDTELERVARQQAEESLQAMHRALAELARLTEHKEPPGRIESSFRQMEVEQALEDIKRKLGGDGSKK